MNTSFIFAIAVCIAASYCAPGSFAVNWEAAEHKVNNIAMTISDTFLSIRNLTYADNPILAQDFDFYIDKAINIISEHLAELREYIDTQSLQQNHAEYLMSRMQIDIVYCKVNFTFEFAYGPGENFSNETSSQVFDWFDMIAQDLDSQRSELLYILRP